MKPSNPIESKKNKRPSKRAVAVFIALFVGGYFVFSFVMSNVAWSVTASLDHTLFYLSDPEEFSDPQRGTFVLFEHENPWKKKGMDLPLLKKVACREGDTLESFGSYFFCNGDFLGQALEADSKGNPLEIFSFQGTVPQGKLFVVGAHARSYDSKYFGFIGVEDVQALASPLF